jgi:iron complex outermembrane receptor protein
MHGINMELLDLERVEVLRGPQGTLFGRNAIGGAVNLVSARPGEEFSGDATITIGRFNRLDFRGTVDVPLIEDKLAIKISGISNNRDGYGKRLDFDTGQEIAEMGDQDRLSGRLVVDWNPQDNLNFLFSLDSARIRETGAVSKTFEFIESGLVGLHNSVASPPMGEGFATDSPFNNYGTGPNINDVDAWGISLTVDWSLDRWSIKSITSYREIDAVNSDDLEGTSLIVLNGTDDVVQDQFSQEIQLSGIAMEDRLNWLAGFYYYTEDASAAVTGELYPTLNEFYGIDISSTRYVTNDVESYAVFGHATYSLNEQLSFTGGLRYTNDEKTASRFRERLDGTVYVPFLSKGQSWDDVTGRAGLEYRFNSDVMAYLSYSRGYKSGGWNGDSSSVEDFVTFDPEYLNNYEIGLRSDWADNRLRVNATFFWSDYTDVQYRVDQFDPDTGEPVEFVGNVAEAEMKGFELDFVARPVSAFTMTAGIGYTDAAYTKVDPGTIAITTDSTFINTPKWSFKASVEYVIPVQDLGWLNARLDYSYSSKVNYDITNLPVLEQDAYSVLNGRLSFEAGDHWSLALFATNLTDELYFVGGRDYGALGFRTRYYAAPRQWGFSVRYDM